MAREYSIIGSVVTVTGDPFEEGKDDFLEFDLIDENEEAIEDAAVSAVTATHRSLDTGAIVNGRDSQDVKDANGGSLTDGTFRLDLTGDGDLLSVGSRLIQSRELTIGVTHSAGKYMPIVARFEVRTHRDVV